MIGVGYHSQIEMGVSLTPSPSNLDLPDLSLPSSYMFLFILTLAPHWIPVFINPLWGLAQPVCVRREEGMTVRTLPHTVDSILWVTVWRDTSEQLLN
jgi:hypothetical protein